MENEKNTYLIGDVHGCYYTLMDLIKKLPKNSNLIFLGDLCDKGNFTLEVIEYIINNNHRSIKGNHEELMLLSLEKEGLETIKNTIWINQFGGIKTINSYKNNKNGKKILEKHIKWLKKLPNYLEIENIFLTHGYGLPYYKRKDEFPRGILSNRLNNKYQDNFEDIEKYNLINIFGHCNVKNIQKNSKYICIDTGSVYGGKLTALKLNSINSNDLKIIQTKLNKKDIK